MDDDLIIDYNHIYNIILDKLLKVFPKSQTGFKFEEIYKEADLGELESDDSYYWFKSFNFNHSEFIRHLLKKDGIIETLSENGNDTRLTKKGLKIVEAESFEKYLTIKERQEKLEQEIKQTTLATNKSVISTNKIQKITLSLSVFVGLCALAVSFVSVWVAYKSQKSVNRQIEISNKSLELQENELKFQQADKLLQQKVDSLTRLLQERKQSKKKDNQNKLKAVK